MPTAEAAPFSYAILRLIPNVERGESLNAGVILFCPTQRFLEARVGLDEERLRAIAPAADADQIRGWLDSVVQTARGENPARAGLSQAERFGLLTAPSSTVIQASPVHTGLTVSPTSELDRLFRRLVG